MVATPTSTTATFSSTTAADDATGCDPPFSIFHSLLVGALVFVCKVAVSVISSVKGAAVVAPTYAKMVWPLGLPTWSSASSLHVWGFGDAPPLASLPGPAP